MSLWEIVHCPLSIINDAREKVECLSFKSLYLH